MGVNRQTTVESLEAAFNLIYNCDNEKSFRINYLKAVHDNNGKAVWWYITKRSSYDKKTRILKKNCLKSKSGV